MLEDHIVNTISITVVDMLVLAKYTRDTNWYRARVTHIDVNTIPAKITVYYVDYGNTEVVTLDR